MLTFLALAHVASAATVTVHVSNADVSITADQTGIIIVGDVDASSSCEKGCEITVVHDDPALGDVGFVGEGVVTADGVALLMDGLVGLHIGQGGAWLGQLNSDKSGDSLVSFLDFPTGVEFDQFLDSPPDDFPVVWFRSGKGYEDRPGGWEAFALASDVTALPDPTEWLVKDDAALPDPTEWLVAAANLRGAAPDSVLDGTAEEGMAVEIFGLETGSVYKDELFTLDSIKFTFDSPIDPAIMEMAIITMIEG